MGEMSVSCTNTLSFFKRLNEWNFSSNNNFFLKYEAWWRETRHHNEKANSIRKHGKYNIRTILECSSLKFILIENHSINEKFIGWLAIDWKMEFLLIGPWHFSKTRRKENKYKQYFTFLERFPLFSVYLHEFSWHC